MTIADLTRITDGLLAAASRAADRLGVTREALLQRVVEGDGVARAYLKAEA
jgi:hypothetical protein